MIADSGNKKCVPRHARALQSTNYPFCTPRNVLLGADVVKRLTDQNRVNCLLDVIGQSAM